jgi:hypothetical protein
VLILDQPIAMPEYGQLPAPGALDGLDTARGNKKTVFTVSGYGLTLSSNPNSAVPNLSYRSRRFRLSARPQGSARLDQQPKLNVRDDLAGAAIAAPFC